MEAGTRQNAQIIHEQSLRYVSDAWNLLLSHARDLASANGVKPEQLILGVHRITPMTLV